MPTPGDGAAVRYHAFGVVRVSGPVPIRVLNRKRERAVLAVLLSARGAPVAAERLLAEVWGEEAPGLGVLQVTVSRLRAALEPDRGARQEARRLVTTNAGYALRAGSEDVDVWRFEDLAEQALGALTPAERLAFGDEAERLWTGVPFAQEQTESTSLARDRLQALRLSVVEARAQALLDLGRPENIATWLAPMARVNPYQERLWALLALAHYRCSRQADALATLHTLRATLVEELGVDPSPEVQVLEHRLLDQDAELLALPDAGPAAPERPPHGASTTVGRDALRRRTRGLLDQVRQVGCCRFVTVSGEPGIGKSRWVQDLELDAVARGIPVVIGRCHEHDYAPGLWPWLEVVRSLLEGGTQEPDPVLRPLLDEAVLSPDTGGGSALRLFDAVVTLLVTRAHESNGLALVLEDVHWADESSLALLVHLARSRPTAPLLVAVTRRTSGSAASPALVDAVAELARAGCERIRLDGLDLPAVAALLDRALGPHDERLDRTIAETTGGNAFFVHEYARLLQAHPGLARANPGDLPVPEGINDVLQQRLARLPATARSLLVSGAVLGRRLDPDAVAGLAGVPVETALDALDLGLASGLLEEDGTGYAFAHALVRDALSSQVTAARRMRLHARAVTVLEGLHGDSPDTVGAIAHHAFIAAPLGRDQTVVALTLLARAAHVARSRHAHSEELDLWRQARVTARAPDLAARREEASRGEAEALLRLGRTREARRVVEGLVSDAAAQARPDLVADAAAVLNQAGVWSWREHGVKAEAFIAALTVAAEQVDAPRRARLHATLTMEHYYGWDPQLAALCGERALEAARSTGDVALLQEVMLVVVVASVGHPRVAQRLELCRELVTLRPQGEVGVAALFHLGFALLESRQVAESDAVMERCRVAAAELQHSGVDIPLAWWQFARARSRDLSEARDLGEQALALHRRSGYIASAELECFAAVRLRRDGEPLAGDACESAGRATPAARALVALCLVEVGDVAAARAVLGPLPPAQATDYAVLAARSLRVAVLATTGPHEQLVEELEQLEQHRGRVVLYGTIDHLGVVEHFLALGYAALGQHDRARELARQAVVENAALDNAPWLRSSRSLLSKLEEPRRPR